MSRREGSVRAVGRDDLYDVRLTMGMVGGKRPVWTKRVRGKRNADRVLAEKLREKHAGVLRRTTRQTLDEWREEWLTTHCRSVSSRTRDDYRTLLDRYLPKEMLGRKLDAIDFTHVQQWVNELSARGKHSRRKDKKGTAKPLSARTVRMAHTALRACLYKAVKLRRMAENPAKGVSLPRLQHREPTFLTPEEAVRLMSAAEGTRFEALFVVMTTAGLRPGEVLALKWSDFDGKTLKIQRALVRDGTIDNDTKTGNKRVVALDGRTIAALDAHRARQDAWREEARDSFRDQGLIFPLDDGTPANSTHIDKVHFKPLLKRAGLPPIRLYDLRHSTASLMHAAGEDLKSIQECLGHRSILLTMNTYTHLSDETRQRRAARLDTLFDAEEKRAKRKRIRLVASG
jgi:integrase